MHQKVTNSTSSEELRDDGSDRDLIVEDQTEDEVEDAHQVGLAL